VTTALLEAGPATIIVDRLEVLRTTDTYTLYEVYALSMDRAPIGTRLRTFDDLPTGTPITVTLENYAPKNGGDPSLTVKYAGARKKRRKAGAQTDTANLEERIARLERQMRAIIGNADIDLGD
jgi:hypothetical protein